MFAKMLSTRKCAKVSMRLPRLALCSTYTFALAGSHLFNLDTID